jgi:hypothetical protein
LNGGSTTFHNFIATVVDLSQITGKILPRTGFAPYYAGVFALVRWRVVVRLFWNSGSTPSTSFQVSVMVFVLIKPFLNLTDL